MLIKSNQRQRSEWLHITMNQSMYTEHPGKHRGRWKWKRKRHCRVKYFQYPHCDEMLRQREKLLFIYLSIYCMFDVHITMTLDKPDELFECFSRGVDLQHLSTGGFFTSFSLFVKKPFLYLTSWFQTINTNFCIQQLISKSEVYVAVIQCISIKQIELKAANIQIQLLFVLVIPGQERTC